MLVANVKALKVVTLPSAPKSFVILRLVESAEIVLDLETKDGDSVGSFFK